MEDNITYDRMISFHRNQQDTKESPVSTLTYAFGDRQYEKITSEMASKDNVLRIKDLKVLDDDFKQADKITLALKTSDIYDELLKCLTEDVEVIRTLASSCFVQIAKVGPGKEKIVTSGSIRNIAKLFDDKVVQIRSHAYHSLLNLAEYRAGIESNVDAGIIEDLSEKLIFEKDDGILALVLELLRKLLDGTSGTTEALKFPIMMRLVNRLDHQNPDIRELAAIAIAGMSFNEQGKQLAIDQGSIKELCELLEDAFDDVRCAGLKALASLAQLKRGKQSIIAKGYLKRVMRLLNDENMQTRLNSVQLICNLAEDPFARKECIKCLNTLESLSKDETYPLVAKYAKTAMDVITWTP